MRQLVVPAAGGGRRLTTRVHRNTRRYLRGRAARRRTCPARTERSNPWAPGKQGPRARSSAPRIGSERDGANAPAFIGLHEAADGAEADVLPGLQSQEAAEVRVRIQPPRAPDMPRELGGGRGGARVCRGACSRCCVHGRAGGPEARGGNACVEVAPPCRDLHAGRGDGSIPATLLARERRPYLVRQGPRALKPLLECLRHPLRDLVDLLLDSIEPSGKEEVPVAAGRLN